MKPIQRLISVLLALVMLLSILPLQILAEEIRTVEPGANEPPTVLQTEDGELPVDESWDEVYPFGAFAFDKTAVDVSEGEDTVVTVYRLGGTRGRATAVISYAPVIAPNEDGSAYYGYALRGDDLTIEVEDPLPIAQYQSVGKLPEPEAGTFGLRCESDAEGLVLRLDGEAEAFSWEVLSEGRWHKVQEADKSELKMSAEELTGGQFDFRCIYTLDGTRYCTESFYGVPYEKAPEEVLEPMPDDLELNPAQSFSYLDLLDDEDMYAGWMFPITFADGEWKKEIRIHANVDGETECIEGATLLISDCEGGEICEASNTLLYHVDDSNESRPSTLGFTVETVSADKAGGTVELLVRREGGNERTVTVEYRTADGSALAGRDYVAAAGTLIFYGHITEQRIRVELIDDRIVSDQALDFTVQLTEPKGDDNCKMETGAAKVELTNSGTGDGANLASELRDSQAVDLTRKIQDSPTFANAGTEAATGEQVETEIKEGVPVGLIAVDRDGNPTRSHDFGDQALINFVGANPDMWGTGDAHMILGSVNFTTSGIGKWSSAQYNYNDPYNSAYYSVFYIEENETGIAFATMKEELCQPRNTDQYIVSKRYFGQMFSRLKLAASMDYDGDMPQYQVNYRVGGTSAILFSPENIQSDYSSWGKHQEYASKTIYLDYGDTFDMDLYIRKEDKERLMMHPTLDLYGRRSFRENAFRVDITTPNDDNTAPEGCPQILDYTEFFPDVTVLRGGAVRIEGDPNAIPNALYVGSVLRFAPKPIPGMNVARVEVLASTDGRQTWTPFTKFVSSASTLVDGTQIYDIRLVGDPYQGNVLNQTDIENTEYKFRVVYERVATVTVDLQPSLPRDANGNADPGQLGQLFNNYNGTEDHCFGDAQITYGCSVYDPTILDYSTVEKVYGPISPTQEQIGSGKTAWTASVRNLQWICFNLPEEDLLLCNSQAYAGNERIYLTQEDMAGDLSILYYHSAYQSYINAMTTAMSWIALYFDGDGDGQISGSYRPADGLYTLTEGTADRFVRFLTGGATFGEEELAPVDLGNGRFGQYYIVLCYSMTPRCLTVPIGENENDRAQVLPAITSAMDPASAAYAELTNEQKQYNYVISGKDETGRYTSDDHLMYGASANIKSILSFPLGGDKSPVVANREGKVYEWTPDWIENCLYLDPHPELVTMTNSLAGPTPVTRDYTFDSEALRYDYGDKGLRQINGYLCSMSGARTFAVVSTIQQKTTGELLAQRGTLPTRGEPDEKPNGDSVTLPGTNTNQSGVYLAKNDDQPMEPFEFNSSGMEDSELPEFSMPFDLNLGGNEIGVLDYFSVILNENQVGFAISIPLVEREQENGTWEDTKAFKMADPESWTQFSKFFTDSNRNDKTWENAKKTGNDRKLGSRKFSVGLSAALGFIWQYSPLDNEYHFYTWEIGVVGELEFRGQIRFSFCPLLYAYLDVSAEIGLKTGLIVIQESKTDDEDVLIADEHSGGDEGQGLKLAHYDEGYSGSRDYEELCTFKTKLKVFNIRFKGKLYMDVLVKEGGKWVEPDKDDGFICGVITSGGKADTQVVLCKKDGYDLDKEVLVRLRALENDKDTEVDITEITFLCPVREVYDFVVWNGIRLAPEIALEVGLGFGVELCKAEIFAHISIGAEFYFGALRDDFDPRGYKYDSDDIYEPARVESFEFAVGLALRVVFVFVSYELDFVTYSVTYDHEEGWKDGWSFLNGAYSASVGDEPKGVHISLPEHRPEAQRLFRPEDNVRSWDTRAYDPSDPSVPFQVSGYGSSVDAANLSEGIPEGSQYKVVRLGEKNYIVYTLSRESEAPEDGTVLVLSELGYAEGRYGLVSPTGDPEQLCLVLDTEDMPTGDLDFDVWADGDTLRAAWVSYGEPARSLTRAESSVQALQQRVRNAAKNTVVKTAAWTPGDTAFTVPEILCRDGAYVFKPASAGDGSAVFFGSTAAWDEDGAAYDAYAAYQETKDLPEQVTNYLKTIRKTNLDLFGTRSALNLAVRTEDGWVRSQAPLMEGQTLANVEFAQLGSDYCVAYSTEQTAYEAGDMITVYRLYLRKAAVEDGKVVWGEPVLIRDLRDYDRDQAGTDGVYSGGALMEGKDYDSPYLSNLRFVRANLDDAVLVDGEPLSRAVSLQTLLIFEMNGSSYVIPQAMLESILKEGTGLIYPFFTPMVQVNADGEAVQEGSSGKLAVDISADAEGRLYAVYLSGVEGTDSNGLFLSCYDPAVNAWGDGVLLALHNMDTYEAAAAYGWNHAATEAAYLWGGLSDLEDELLSLYGEEAIETVKAAKPSELGDGKIFTFNELQTIQGENGELLAVVQGSTRSLTVGSYQSGEETKYVLQPVCGESGMAAELGTYVVSFSQGRQALGGGKISFASEEFSAGSQLHVTLDAVNAGTTAFRGSEAQPITAELKVKGQTIAAWEIKENILSGQAIALSGWCAPLALSLSDGDVFTLTVSEDSSYAGTPAVCSIDLFTVEDKPDLSIEAFQMDPLTVAPDGSEATMNLSFVAANQGSLDAKNVYAQFSYVSGYDEAGQPVYAPLDLTGSELTVDLAAPLSELLRNRRVTASDLERGILLLTSPDGSNDIPAGYGKRVSGTVSVPASLFTLQESRHAEIRIELFSDADTVTSFGRMIEAEHGEYCPENNAVSKQIEAWTVFAAAHHILIPLGTTTRVPLSAVSVRGEKPKLQVEEIGDEDGKNLGILNFRQSSSDGGTVSGILSLTPVQAGSGILHVTDTETNTTYAIAFEVTDNTDGIDIYEDNEAFTFRNADDSVYAKGTEVPQDWRFIGSNAWGETDAVQETPLRGNLSVGSKDAYFSFDTVAEGMDLYFLGSIRVSSTNPNFSDPGELTNKLGGSSPTFIDLGENPDNAIYTVTVRVSSQQASFDRLVEHYAGGVVPIPAYDGVSPLFIWSRSFPDTGSLLPGSPVTLQLYVLDNNGVASLSVGDEFTDNAAVEGDTVTVLDGNNLLWRYDFDGIAENGDIEISATDVSGNQTTTVLSVDWFLYPTTGNASTVPVPLYTPDFCLDGVLVGDEVIGSTDGLTITFREDTGNLKPDGNRFEAYFFDGEAFHTISSDGEGIFPVAANGIYLARTVNEDKTWSAKVLVLDQIDPAFPQANLYYNESSGELVWSASKTKTGVKITNVTLNDWKLNSEEGWDFSGSLPISCNGDYTLVVEDEAGHTVTVLLALSEVPLAIRTAEVSGAWNQSRNNGSILIKRSAVTGGQYLDAPSASISPAAYHTDYEIAMVPGAYDPTDSVVEWEALEAERLWADLEPGSYTILLRVAAEPDEIASLEVNVADESIRADVAVQDASEASISDGAVIVTVAELPYSVEFALIPAADIPDGEIAAYLKTNTVTWLPADEGVEEIRHTFDALAKGSYYVAVRGVFDEKNDAWYETHPEYWEGAAVLPVTVKAIWTNPFEDVKESDYFYEAVRWAVQHEPQVTNGTDETHFSPKSECTRGQVVVFLWNAAGSPEPTSTDNPFTDVSEDAYYYQAVLWAIESGITAGTSETTFSPNESCTRAQVVTFLWRFADTPEPASTDNPFTDVKDGKYYTKAVLWAAENHITAGTSATTFSPDAVCTRAQAVTFLCRYLEG